jgi:hypothetical protein
LVAAIWLIIEFKRMRHKILAIFLIVLILFTYFSFSAVIKEKNLDLKTFDGMKEAGRLYFLWIGNAFTNVKVITSNAINLSWGVNETSNLNETLKLNSTSKSNNSKILK